MMNLFFLTGEATADVTSGGSMISAFLPIILIFVVFYFFIIRPEKKRKKEVDTMRNELKVGDKITTIGGIVGKVTNVNDKEDLITIETGADGVKLRITRWAIGTKEAVEEKVEEKLDESNGLN